MAENGADWASRFEQANREIIAAVEGLSHDQWTTIVPGEDWTVGVVAHHVGYGHTIIAQWAEVLAGGGAIQATSQEIDDENAEHARQFASCTKEETIRYLAERGEVAAQVVRGLSDEQLARPGEFRGVAWTAAEMIERVLIGHAQRHMEHVQSVLS
jgi:uncharacterized damage-inducible protein DinB